MKKIILITSLICLLVSCKKESIATGNCQTINADVSVAYWYNGSSYFATSHSYACYVAFNLPVTGNVEVDLNVVRNGMIMPISAQLTFQGEKSASFYFYLVSDSSDTIQGANVITYDPKYCYTAVRVDK